ncbi:hypothetical protein I0C86_41095 [Plantactinospora sp. S1510]|uniref:Uncharacterized protein n=1 Tax=Plantactinospora alkalitolerans TaxID=2789879 RepID=A0ABS0HAS2_9ACTN|nr:hypothetical protein [Plantactinospora alkalitolerans]MBF9135249.1 hypothetical protein [Plantactinospora alkalitolerans]
MTGRNTECPARQDEEGFGEHEPGTPVLRPPARRSAELVDPATLAPPAIPWIPRSAPDA